MRDFIEDSFGTNRGEMVIDSFTLGNVPFEEADDGTPAAQVRAEHRACDADGLLGDRVGIIGNHHRAAGPHDPVEIRDCPFDVQPAAVRPDGLADGSAPVVNAGNSHRQKAGLCSRPVVRQAPQGEGLELPLRDHDGQGCVAKGLLANAGHDVQQVGPARRTDVFLPGLQSAGQVVVEVGLIPAQTVLADASGAGVEIRNEENCIVAVLAAGDFSTGKRIDSTQARADTEVAVNPTRLQLGKIRACQIRPDQTGRPKNTSLIHEIACNKWRTFERIFVFCLRAVVVYTIVERIHFSPPVGRWLALERGPLSFRGERANGRNSVHAASRTEWGNADATVSEPYQYRGC